MSEVTNLTEQQFYKKYGGHWLKFESYYKYCFTFVAELDEDRSLTVVFGGNHHDIYRFEISCSSSLQVYDLPYVSSAHVYRKSTRETIEQYID